MHSRTMFDAAEVEERIEASEETSCLNDLDPDELDPDELSLSDDLSARLTDFASSSCDETNGLAIMQRSFREQQQQQQQQRQLEDVQANVQQLHQMGLGHLAALAACNLATTA